MTNEKFLGRAFTVIIFLFMFSHSILGTLVKKKKKKKYEMIVQVVLLL